MLGAHRRSRNVLQSTGPFRANAMRVLAQKRTQELWRKFVCILNLLWRHRRGGKDMAVLESTPMVKSPEHHRPESLERLRQELMSLLGLCGGGWNLVFLSRQRSGCSSRRKTQRTRKYGASATRPLRYLVERNCRVSRLDLCWGLYVR